MAQPPTNQSFQRRLHVGAEVQTGGGVHFRVWAPRRSSVTVVLSTSSGTSELPLAAEGDGYFSGFSPDAAGGTRYGYRLDDDPKPYPDPASRRQPEGPHALSEVVDPAAFAWHDGQWPGIKLHGQVIYELHISTFTPEGTWAAAAKRLPDLVELGVTSVEVMPVAEYDGEFGWGYDGVNLFAPTRLYGEPDDFRRFVDEAHRLGLGVILDVVYNHFGPVGNYVGQFSDDYTTPKHQTGWGDAINYDAQNSGPVREYFAANAGYWIDEYHIDGLRLDAVHAIIDDSPEHILAAVTRRVREKGQGRGTLVIAENEFQQCYLLRDTAKGGYGLDAGWNDDFHHVARVAATGDAAHYFADYAGTPQEFLSLARWGHLYQGQYNPRQERHRGTPGFDLDGAQFVNFLQNHDQVGNLPGGARLHQLTSPGRFRALTALLCLAPGTPLLFQGQEFAATSPYYFFADHEPDLAPLVREGRLKEMFNFRAQADPRAGDHFPDPAARETFEQSRIDHAERDVHQQAWQLHRDLLKLRREDAVFASQRADRIHGAVIGPEAFLLRYFGEDGDDRLVLVNLGRDFDYQPAAEPLVAPPAGRAWNTLWSSEELRYGGLGVPPLGAEYWFVPGHAAFVLAAARA
ncbi:MAG: malto-oligosyltrehalose trehalohydrolase [Planctomycetota bacterium]|nr:MAG: malto-oligosyltrehalose trehalohydrolase [Planctomycetota bacterium]